MPHLCHRPRLYSPASKTRGRMRAIAQGGEIAFKFERGVAHRNCFLARISPHRPLKFGEAVRLLSYRPYKSWPVRNRERFRLRNHNAQTTPCICRHFLQGEGIKTISQQQLDPFPGRVELLCDFSEKSRNPSLGEPKFYE